MERMDDRGFSLVELIVVVLIMAILGGGVVISVRVMHDRDVTAAADKLVSMLSYARTTAMAKDDGTVRIGIDFSGDNYYARIYYDHDGNPSTDEVVLSEQKIAGESIEIKLEDDSGSEVIISESQTAEFHFKKSNGSIRESYKKITVSGSETETIAVIRETGRCVRNPKT